MDATKRKALKARHEAIKTARSARRDLVKCLAGSAVFTTPEISRQQALASAQVR